MKRNTILLLAAVIALSVGCAHNKKCATTKMAANDVTECTADATANNMSDASASNETAATPSPAVATDNLAGTWNLAIPRQKAQAAKITRTDETHVTIEAGDTLSGDYVVQGNYLLIITRDEKLRPLAWKINSADSLTVVRSPEVGDSTSNYTGVTLIRAADSTASSDSESSSSQASTSDSSQQ